MSPCTSPDEVESPFPPAPRPRDTIREWDRRAIEEYGIPGVVLMENAGAGAARIIRHLAATEAAFAPPFHILCGPGNNGGDGFVVARHLHNSGLPVRVLLTTTTSYRAGSDAALNLEIIHRMGSVPVEAEVGPASGSIHGPIPRSLEQGTLVDALFGTGLTRALESPHTEWIDAINSSGRKVIALDIPSGLDADTGTVLGTAVRANHTTTFAAAKVGFACGQGPALCGVVHVVDIGLPLELWRG